MQRRDAWPLAAARDAKRRLAQRLEGRPDDIRLAASDEESDPIFAVVVESVHRSATGLLSKIVARSVLAL